ncbi:4-hydroxybenzoate solanesyltransferase [Anabaena cylindrica FACHB-243]|uniref:4-hydroxybenzoate solanesyltransferase n=1 Tax=Anabaena cylindrica (strain ATCC 27899 / PCC 7122) TaxID=272123 RepID=K9ZKK1_ANACC|nr:MULTISPECIES: 4-hydroxybenzoate solanesyltransferase [Anabaena]AFZ59092.1 4-hydroxybenzoate octaprenyltransferase [Anabaena cylindrica PCC 7122]MBD2420569.1 4-hydroxybenzoate solanesyltransferase [Anabaena cylindrica FACHB-243]MBY5284434.1 4-hydroxybenzoate solanesyltransferase [Anabaena sp. CCAP 1446/1C]MBY5309001.1 4-hydroxybenzoate solanesyltransferase [Anabaena sp. CCAP 1446/1C]MCM2408527.1 4-hydroxybenzoate solanesyltransferase [Anabaena sp. CCAP 1446/1C]
MLKTSENDQKPLWLVIIQLLRWHKPEGRLILMIPALWAVFLASAGKPPLPLVGVIILGTLATSAAGCVVNDLWDRDIDPQVERTRDRPLASRSLSVKVGIGVGIVALACAAVLAFYLNPLSFWLSVAAVPVILLYPGAKRVFPVPQLVLSIAWGFAVLISWSAVTQNISAPTWLLWGATVLWTLGFDTIYAMSDREDDQRIGINSSALFFGKYSPTAIGIFFVGTVILLAGIGVLVHLNTAFWISLIIATFGWLWQSLQLRNPELPNPVYGEMFRQNVWIGFLILAGMIVGSF